MQVTDFTKCRIVRTNASTVPLVLDSEQCIWLLKCLAKNNNKMNKQWRSDFDSHDILKRIPALNST